MPDKPPVAQKPCRKCAELEDVLELGADGLCRICHALLGLRATMIEKGRMQPRLWDEWAQLPPGDRE